MASSSSSGVTPEDENRIITKLGLAAEGISKEGDTFFMLINPRWWRELNKYCDHFIATKASANIGEPSNKMKRPSTIDNAHMINQAAELVPDIELHDNLVEGSDYILIPETAWNQLHAWYGGGPTLARKAIQCNNELYIEVYPLRLHLHLTPKSGKSRIRISKMVLIWDYYQLSKLVVLNEMEKTLVDANIQMDQDILVEIIDHGKQPGKIMVGSDDTQVFEIDNFTSPGREPCTNTATDGVSVGKFPRDLIGMKNLGNTCYLNSDV